MAAYENRYWSSGDGLQLHYRDYPGDPARPPILCLPGLTRNARDFAELAERLAVARGWRVLTIDLRGRGGSASAKDAASYVPGSYVKDIGALLVDQAIDRYVAFGTSLGGVVTMLLAASGSPMVAALLNDIGPEIDPAGLSRIRGYVGRSSSCPTWMHAARTLAAGHADIYPDWGIEDWLAMAKRLYRLSSKGRIVLDYDMKIAEPFRLAGNETPPDIWGALAALRGIPTLIVRGERSDILAPAVAKRMVAMLDPVDFVTVPRVGHTPLLTEDTVRDPIDRLLACVAEPVPG